MRRVTLTRLNILKGERRAAVVVTFLDRGTEILVAEGDSVDGDLAHIVAAALRSGKSARLDVEGEQVFVNVYLPPVRIVIIGAVHISQALAPMARLAGFDVTIIDPRSAFATPERFDETQLIIDWPEDSLLVDPYTALVAVAHDPKIDDFPLAAALQAGCFYIGALGSRKSHAARLERLRMQGLSEAQLAPIHAPVGLDIGAANPAEIAVAILAEIIQALRRRAVSATVVRA